MQGAWSELSLCSLNGFTAIQCPVCGRRGNIGGQAKYSWAERAKFSHSVRSDIIDLVATGKDALNKVCATTGSLSS